MDCVEKTHRLLSMSSVWLRKRVSVGGKWKEGSGRREVGKDRIWLFREVLVWQVVFGDFEFVLVDGIWKVVRYWAWAG